MDITNLTMPTGLMLTYETSKCKIEICNCANLFSIKINVASLCEQTLLQLYAVKIRICIVVPEKNSLD